MIQIVGPIDKHSIVNKIQAQNWWHYFLDSTPINPEGLIPKASSAAIK